ncbi:type IV pilus modification protein PilV [Neiella marina]|uniref:type IV pilus modification protein PilV n=1 Tax=Neiella marina TaxID=508461 RepID=UPI0013021D30|nr:type IV pilus modification protein PilV [Neiella marina]
MFYTQIRQATVARRSRTRSSLQSGVTLIEILVAVVVLGIGVLGALALQGTAKRGNLEAFQRTQAVLIARDLAERMVSNRTADLDSYQGTYTGSTVTTFSDCLGLDSCTPEQMVSWDLYQFDQAIKGGSEVRGDRDTGALINAEGCVSHTAGLIQIVLVWKGVRLGATPVSPIAGCGSDISAKERRMFVFTTFVGAN